MKKRIQKKNEQKVYKKSQKSEGQIKKKKKYIEKVKKNSKKGRESGEYFPKKL